MSRDVTERDSLRTKITIRDICLALFRPILPNHRADDGARA